MTPKCVSLTPNYTTNCFLYTSMWISDRWLNSDALPPQTYSLLPSPAFSPICIDSILRLKLIALYSHIYFCIPSLNSVSPKPCSHLQLVSFPPHIQSLSEFCQLYLQNISIPQLPSQNLHYYHSSSRYHHLSHGLLTLSIN